MRQSREAARRKQLSQIPSSLETPAPSKQEMSRTGAKLGCALMLLSSIARGGYSQYCRHCNSLGKRLLFDGEWEEPRCE